MEKEEETIKEEMDIVDWLRLNAVTEEDIFDAYEEEQPGFKERLKNDPELRNGLTRVLWLAKELRENLTKAADTIEQLRWELDKAQKEE